MKLSGRLSDNVTVSFPETAPVTFPLTPEHLGGAHLEQPDPNTWTPDVWGWLLDEYRISTMLDVGCGAGFVLEWFSMQGIHSTGIEGDPAAVHLADGRARRVIEHDFTTGPYEFPSNEWRFDLGWCAEFVEHVEARYTANWMAALQRCRLVVMTFAVPGQPGHHHVNCQTEEHWQAVFRQAGFDEVRDQTLRMRATCRGGEAYGRPTLTMWRNRFHGNLAQCEHALGPIRAMTP